MHSVHGRRERQVIVLNKRNQLVGPSKAAITELGSFLGTLARNAALCALDICDWRKMDTKEDLWAYTKEKYDIPDAAKKWILETVQASWRKHKSRLKKDHFKAYANDEIRMKNRPEDVPASQFKSLLEYWNDEKDKKMSEINIENRLKLKNPHTTGKTSFAVICNELEKTRDTSDPLSLKHIFVATRTRKPGRSYKDSDEDTIKKIVEMEEIEKQQTDGGNESVNAFSSVMGPEHPGRLRLYGRGVTRASLKEKVGYFEHSQNCTNDFQKMEEWMQKMEEKFEQQKINIRQEVVEDVIGKLQRSGLTLDPNIIATLCDHSVPQSAIKPIHRPSIDSNNQVRRVSGGADVQEVDDESSEDLT